MDDERDYLIRLKKYKESKNHTELRYCSRCGRVFPYSGAGEAICPQCQKKEQEDFDRVKAYLKDHHATENEVSEATGVPVDTLTKWAREGLLCFGEGLSGLRCELCGKPISFGRYCTECQIKLKKKGFMNSRFGSGKMRFAGRDDK